MNNTQTDTNTTAIVPAIYAHMNEADLVQVEIKRGTFICGPEEEYGVGAVLLVLPEDAAMLERTGHLGFRLPADFVLQNGSMTPEIAQAMARGQVQSLN